MKVGISLGKGLVPLLFSSLIILCLAGCAEDSSILDNKQSRQLEFSVTTHGWNSSITSDLNHLHQWNHIQYFQQFQCNSRCKQRR